MATKKKKTEEEKEGAKEQKHGISLQPENLL
jgi:hypothetical protein